MVDKHIRISLSELGSLREACLREGQRNAAQHDFRSEPCEVARQDTPINIRVERAPCFSLDNQSAYFSIRFGIKCYLAQQFGSKITRALVQLKMRVDCINRNQVSFFFARFQRGINLDGKFPFRFLVIQVESKKIPALHRLDF